MTRWNARRYANIKTYKCHGGDHSKQSNLSTYYLFAFLFIYIFFNHIIISFLCNIIFLICSYMLFYFFVFYYIILYYFILYYAILYYILFYYMMLNCIIYIHTKLSCNLFSRYVFYTFSILLPSHACLAAGFYINCTPPLEETSNHPNKQRKKDTKKHRPSTLQECHACHHSGRILVSPQRAIYA